MLKDTYKHKHDYGYSNLRVPFIDLIGETLTNIDINKANDEIVFTTSNGRQLKMYHSQDCCEGVAVESVVGDFKDLIGTPITQAEESIGDTPNDFKFEYEPESYTWTFYKLATVKGYVDIRWLGESNGYYSESVDFVEVQRQDMQSNDKEE